MKMNDELKRWIHELRTTKSKQVHGQLMSVDLNECRYCCLGIGALVLGQEFDEDLLGDEAGGPCLVGDEDENDITLSATLFAQFGLPEEITAEEIRIKETIKVDGVQDPQLFLAKLNDSGDWPFSRIAQGVENWVKTGIFSDDGWKE